MGLSAASDAVDREPAIDDQLGASDVYRLVGREEQRRVSDIPGIAHAPIGHCSSRRRTISSALPPYAAMTSAACTIGVFIIPGKIEFAPMPDRGLGRRVRARRGTIRSSSNALSKPLVKPKWTRPARRSSARLTRFFHLPGEREKPGGSDDNHSRSKSPVISRSTYCIS